MWTSSMMLNLFVVLFMFVSGDAGSSESITQRKFFSDPALRSSLSFMQVGSTVLRQNGSNASTEVRRPPSEDRGIRGLSSQPRELRPSRDVRNITVTREFQVVNQAMRSQASVYMKAEVGGDTTSDIVLGMTILAVTLVLVAAMCLYVDKDDDLSSVKRQARKPLRGSGNRSGGERPVRNRPVPASLENRIAGGVGGGFPAGGMGSPPGAQPAVRPDGSFDQRQSPAMQAPVAAGSPMMTQQPIQQASPLQPQMVPQPQRPSTMPAAQAPPGGGGWERASIGSSIGGSFRSMSGILGTTGGNQVKRPPALCAALVLPHCEAWFAVSWDKIAAAAPSFEFYGLSGKPLLRASVAGSLGNRKVSISMTPTRSPTLGSVTGGGAFPLEVRGAGDKIYGELVKGQGLGQFTLIHSTTGEEVVSLSFEAAPSYQMMLRTASGPIAAGSRCIESDFSSGIEHLEVRVNPGVDAVLVLCCVLGIILVEGVDMPTGRSLGSNGPPPQV